MKKILRLFVLIIILVLAACGQRDYVSDGGVLGPEQVLEYYCKACSQGKREKIHSVLSNEMKAKTADYGAIKTMDLISFERITETEVSSTIEGLCELYIYKVEIDYEFKGEFGKDRFIRYYHIGKEMENSPWLIYDITD